ncbi:hypothetical protein [Brevundimonas sp.]|uniref:hypothetical protein n=1 Tax=Brevundimonas sp. TaxID=1871086 RepID=UPI0027310C54|nr:hypothetical protein [Brevundimonas sp.]MDP1911715.1 hypothetical protein [Brevundimonas sp.]
MSAALALWRGGRWERATAAVLVLVWIGTALAHFDSLNPPWVIIGLDGATLLFLLYLALYSKRRWTIWATAFQFLLMANHLAFVRFHELEQWAYVTAYYVWGDAVLLSLMAGAIWRARKTTPAVAQNPGNMDRAERSELRSGDRRGDPADDAGGADARCDDADRQRDARIAVNEDENATEHD